MTRILLSLSVWLCLAATAVAQPLPTNEQMGSIYCAYPEPTDPLTPAPDGYEPFYISHYGRHGSRWRTEDGQYRSLVVTFDSLHACGNLTPLGENVRVRLQRLWEDACGRSGQITPLGERQHRGIARRMYEHFPQVFADSAAIDARSSTSLRCAMSMSYFTESLKEQNPALRVTRRAYQRYMSYIAHTSPEAEAFCSDTAAWRKDFRAFEQKHIRPHRLMRALLARPDELPGWKAIDLFTNLYWSAVVVQNCDHLEGVGFFDLFTPDELMGAWQVVNARMYVCNAAAPLNGGLMPRQAIPLLRNVVESADRAIAAGRPTADLRFGHDTHLIRLLALMQVEGCANRETDMEKFWQAWPDYAISPMAANLQLVFFRPVAGDGEVLVKLLLNEREVSLPLPSLSGPYYRWTAVRAYFAKLIGER